jgi:hypothetical protein
VHDVAGKVLEIQRAGEMSELMRESRIRHRKVKLQCGDESARGNSRSSRVARFSSVPNQAIRD